MIDESTIREALGSIQYPGFSRDIVSFGLVKEIAVDGGNVAVKLSFATRDPNVPRELHEKINATLRNMEGVDDVNLEFDLKEPPPMQQAAGSGGGMAQAAKIPGVANVIAVASGKGGVGKSTVASNLAIALARDGSAVGICDCDLYGPSIGMMFGTEEQPMANEQQQILPIRQHGLQLMSMSFLVDEQSPVIVRGPMATRYTQQFLRNVVWDNLDYLILDLPPGTGDIQLTIVQTVALAGAVIVTTPQEVALIDARKAVSMFGKVNVPILGLVENMSYFICPNDGNRYHIFGEGGGKAEAETLGVPLLGQIPIDIPTREGGDQGQPVALKAPSESPVSEAFSKIAAQLRETIAARA